LGNKLTGDVHESPNHDRHSNVRECFSGLRRSHRLVRVRRMGRLPFPQSKFRQLRCRLVSALSSNFTPRLIFQTAARRTLCSSSDSNIASVSAGGIATGSASGTVTIKATSGSVESNASLTITAAAANLVSISLSPAASSIPVNTSQQFTATGTYSDGSSADLTSLVTWNSSTTATAIVSVIGLLTAVAAGSTNISASFAGVSQSTLVTVTAPTVVSIAVTPVGQTLGIGIGQQYVATATYSDGSCSDLSSGVTWSSSSTSAATVSTSGVVTTVGLRNHEHHCDARIINRFFNPDRCCGSFDLNCCKPFGSDGSCRYFVAIHRAGQLR